ncbi:MAG: hypothetical protein MOGMAGMI_00339 [Candidatus Omnitrophica bacterium]|nr:hypothetical protein [Candidatus Omnitrophota bacterium]
MTIALLIGYFIGVIFTVYLLQKRSIASVPALLILGFASPILLASILLDALLMFFGVRCLLILTNTKKG